MRGKEDEFESRVKYKPAGPRTKERWLPAAKVVGGKGKPLAPLDGRKPDFCSKGFAGVGVVESKIRTGDFTFRIEQTHTCGKRGPAAAQRQKGHCTRDGERTPRRRGAGFEGQQQEYPPTHQTLDTCGASTSATQGMLQQARSWARSREPFAPA